MEATVKANSPIGIKKYTAHFGQVSVADCAIYIVSGTQPADG